MLRVQAYAAKAFADGTSIGNGVAELWLQDCAQPRESGHAAYKKGVLDQRV